MREANQSCLSRRDLLDHGGNMERRKPCLGFVICKNKHPAALWVERGMIARRNQVVAPVARPNEERHKRYCIQQLANPWNYASTLRNKNSSLKTR